MGLKRGHQAHPIEWLVERAIFVISFSTLFLVFLICGLLILEALPIVLGQTKDSISRNTIPVEDLDQIPPDQLREYLDLTKSQYAAMDKQTLRLLMEVKIQEQGELSDDPDASLNTTRWRYLLFPRQWSGYDQPEFIWQPVSPVPKYNLIPLFIGTLKTTLVALLFAIPFSLAAAIYVSQLANPRWREWLKPGIELLAGVPSVVLGFFALMVMATFLQNTFGYPSRLNAFVAGIALGLAVIPLIFSITEDALTSVPRSYSEAALALGSTKWQSAWHIVLPAALPGVFAAIFLGVGRAIGETMIVLMVSGNASIVSANLLDSTRTMTATIAAELAETVFGGNHYRMLFALGALLFFATFVTNVVGDLVVHRLKRRLEGKA